MNEMDADALAAEIVRKCAGPQELPDLVRLRLAIIEHADVKFRGRRTEISAATGVGLRTMHGLVKQYRALLRQEANERRIITSDGG